MRIVVTGGAGFIGSNIVDAYIAENHEVFVIDDFSSGRRSNVNPRARVHEIDIADPRVARLFADVKPDILNHHAAQMDLRRSVADPVFDARINIIGFLNLLEACRNGGVKKVIYASSGGVVYGEQEAFPATEDHPTRPLSPYGVSKLAGELYLSYYQKAFGIPYIALRYANIYGPRQSSQGEAGVVAIFIGHLFSGKSPVINGDGKQTRDYVYVGDVVRANVAALDSGHVGGVNIGTGHETDVVTIFDLLRRAIGSDIQAVHGPAKVGEQRRSCLDASLASQVLGWKPRVPLEEGLKHTISYHRNAGRS